MKDAVRINVSGGRYKVNDGYKPRKIEVGGYGWSEFYHGGTLFDFYIGEVLFEDFTEKQIKQIRKALKGLLKEDEEK